MTEDEEIEAIIESISASEKTILDTIEKAYTNTADKYPNSKYKIGDLIDYIHTYEEGSWNQYTIRVPVMAKIIGIAQSYNQEYWYKIRYEYDKYPYDANVHENQVKPVFTS